MGWTKIGIFFNVTLLWIRVGNKKSEDARAHTYTYTHTHTHTHMRAHTQKLLVLWRRPGSSCFLVHAHCTSLSQAHGPALCLRSATPSCWWRRCGAATAAGTISLALRSGPCRWPLDPAPEPGAPGLSDPESYCTHIKHITLYHRPLHPAPELAWCTWSIRPWIVLHTSY